MMPALGRYAKYYMKTYFDEDARETEIRKT